MSENANDEAAQGETGTPASGDPLAEALAREGELKDRLLRAMAETENVRRRAERERQEASLYGLTRFAKELLGVADNLARALQSLTPEARANASEPVQNLISGIELTEKELHRIFDRFEIKRVEPLGESFNAHLHQAIAQVAAAQPAGIVVNVAQVGFTLGERLLRPAMVVVSAGEAPKPAGGSEGPAAGEPGRTIDTRA